MFSQSQVFVFPFSVFCFAESESAGLPIRPFAPRWCACIALAPRGHCNLSWMPWKRWKRQWKNCQMQSSDEQIRGAVRVAGILGRPVGSTWSVITLEIRIDNFLMAIRLLFCNLGNKLKSSKPLLQFRAISSIPRRKHLVPTAIAGTCPHHP